jgi:hypothetical protein
LQIPAELTSAGVVVTQAGAIVGSGQLTAPATNASVSLPAASGVYTLTVFGAPGASFSVGSYSLCVAPKASPSNCITQSAAGAAQGANGSPSFSGLITAQNSAKDPTVSTLSSTLTVTTAGSYTFNFSDLAFPAALNAAPQLALFQGIQPIYPPGQTTPGIAAGTALTLGPGVYTLLSIAQASQTVQQGLYEITITGPSGPPLLSTAVPVGLLPNAAVFANPSAQNVTLTVTDYGLPGPLASASAILTSGATVVGSASAAGGAQTFAAPAGNLSLWTYGSLGNTAGTFSADVSAGTSDLYTTAQAVGPSGTTYTYAYVVPAPTLNASTGVSTETGLTAGAYTATATDLKFPSQLGGLAFAVAQNGLILQQSNSAATLNFTAAQGNVILLVSATAPSNTASGLFDVNIQSTGASAGVVFDQTQYVSSSPTLFNTQTVTVADDADYDVTLTDLKFPEAFASLSLMVTRGSDVLGMITTAGTFTFTGSPGTYTLTFVASPSADQQFGLYADSVVFSPPTVNLTSSVATATTGSSITLTWSSTNATSCTGSGGSFTGTGTSGTASVTLAATTTYTMTCTGTGGSGMQSVSVTGTTPPHKSGGGALDPAFLLLGLGLSIARIHRRGL